jgi:hypothetical protein
MTRTVARSAAALAALLAVSCGQPRRRPPDPTFEITLRYCSSTSSGSCQPATAEEFPEAWRAVFRAEADRLEQAITRGLVPVNVKGMDCGRGTDAMRIREDVHGLVVLVSLRDLGGSTLAQSGPCIVRSESGLPLVSVLRFNTAHIESYFNAERLDTVVLHELLHTVGFGTVWCDVTPSRLRNSRTVNGVCVADPVFTGPAALAAAKTYNDAPSSWTTVPVEDASAGTGTGLSHWSEVTFDTELMTGWVEPAPTENPLSAMSLASLADLGYEVDLGGAETYFVPTPPAPGAALRVPSADAVYVGDDVLGEPPVVADELADLP